jgi:hypothetical protein
MERPNLFPDEVLDSRDGCLDPVVEFWTEGPAISIPYKNFLAVLYVTYREINNNTTTKSPTFSS